MASKTTIFANTTAPHSISINTPYCDLLSRFKKSVKKVRFIALLVILVFSFKGNAQCTITGATVNSGTITCTTLAGCTTVYIGDGVNPTNLVMNANLNLTCLGAIQLVIRNNANIDFSDGNYDLDLALNSSIIVDPGGNISAGTNCSASDLIRIGGVNVSSCNGGGKDNPISFPILVSGGGYNTVNATSTIVCGSGTSTITAVKNPTPTSETTYRLYNQATGGTLIQTITISSSPYVAYFTTPSISTTTNFFIDATTAGVTTLRRQVTVTVNPVNTVTASTSQTRCINTVLSPNLTHTTTGATGIGAATGLPAGVSVAWASNSITISGTPTASGTFNYTIPLTGGCGTVNATGTITVNPLNTIVAGSNQTVCINSAITNITLATTGATGATFAGLPAGVTGSWAANVATISGTPTASGTFNYTVTTTGGCGVVNATGTITVNTINAWNGSVSTDWNTAANWSCNVVPNNTSNILIPVVTNFPLISTDDISINNITIDSGAVLNVGNNGLTITGTLTLNGKIDLQNESQLVQTTSSVLISDCTTGKIEIDQQGTSDCFSYNYWGSPVNTTCATSSKLNNIKEFLKDGSFSENIKDFLYGPSAYFADNKSTPINNGTQNIKLSTYWMYKFANKPAGDYNSWTPIGNTGVLSVGEGFTLKGSNSTYSNQNYTFVGIPNNGLIELTVNNGMQYLIGNPYPSSIDAREFIKDNIKEYIGVDGTPTSRRTENIIDGNLYFWDHYGYSTHFLNSYQGGYAIYNLSGGVAFQRVSVSGIPPPIGSGKIPSQFIPVAQGFFVNGLTNLGKIQFKNSQRANQKEAFGISQFIRTTEKNNSKNQTLEKDLTQRIYLKYNSPNGFNRQILAAFIPNTTDGIDIGYDAINNDKLEDDMSWVGANTKMLIQAIPTLQNRVLPLEVKVSSKGITKISLDQIDNISNETAILLKDNVSGILYNLKLAPFEINLSPGTYTNRFEIIFQTQNTLAIEESLAENIVSIYLNNPNNTIYINKYKSVEIKEIMIYNMMGQQLQSIKKELDSQQIKIPLNAQNGVYIVKVKTNSGTISKKVIKY